MKDLLRHLILCLPFVAGTMSVPSHADTLEPGMVNPGSIDHPSWFKLSFLDIQEDVKEAAEAKKRVVLYFYQDGCPYCLKLIREGFTDQTIVNQASRDFDVIALTLFGSREVTDMNGQQWTESQFAASQKVQFTPTLMYLNEDGEVILRVKSRQIIDTFFEQIRLFLIPVFHGLKGRDVTQGLLWKVLIIDLDVAFDGVGQVLG